MSGGIQDTMIVAIVFGQLVPWLWVFFLIFFGLRLQSIKERRAYAFIVNRTQGWRYLAHLLVLRVGLLGGGLVGLVKVIENYCFMGREGITFRESIAYLWFFLIMVLFCISQSIMILGIMTVPSPYMTAPKLAYIAGILCITYLQLSINHFPRYVIGRYLVEDSLLFRNGLIDLAVKLVLLIVLLLMVVGFYYHVKKRYMNKIIVR